MSPTTKAMKPESENMWAVLVGMDQHEDPRNHLYGCVQDATTVYNFLESNLNVPPEHIKFLVSPHERELDCSAPDAPTRDNVMQALENLLNKEKGAFILFYYSGHGAQTETTRFADLKKGQRDEMICPLKKDIYDVELGDLLEKLGRKHTVLAILDCCHSGGADREGRTSDDEAIRSRPFARPTSASRDSERQVLDDDMDIDEAQDRNVIPKYESPLYHKRNYNIIAACQPNELAKELKFPKDITVQQTCLKAGAMTYYLLEALNQFSDSQGPVTYAMLEGSLAAKMKADDRILQKPLHLGDDNLVVFATTARSTIPRGQTNVIKKVGDSVVLNRGSSRHVATGDKFLLYPPAQASLGSITADDASGIEVKVTTVDEFQSIAALTPDSNGSLKSVQPGWFARLSSRSNRKTVYVKVSPDDNHPALKALRHVEVKPSFPFKLVFTAPEEDAEFTVQIGDDGNFHLLDRAQSPMNDLPLIKANVDGVEQLMTLLNRISSYQMLVDMIQGPGGVDGHFEFSLEPREHDPKPDDSLGRWRVLFKNTSPTTLYLTILALGPAYGVVEVYPDRFFSGTELAVNQRIPENVFVDIVLPDLFADAKDKPGFTMADRILAIVSRDMISFKEYEQSDLEANPDNLECDKYRVRVVRPQIPLLFARDLKIITQRLGENDYITYDSSNPPPAM